MRNVRRLIASSGLSNLADGVFSITLPLIALGITRDPAAFASVIFVGRLPWLIFALPAGALADRLDRRITMTSVSLFRAAAIAVLAGVVAANGETIIVLYVAAFALGVGETLFDTAAQSILPMLTEHPDHLVRANSRLSAVELVTNQFIGPPLGAFIAGITLSGALIVSSGSYLLAGIVLLTLTGRFRPIREGPRTRITADVAAGVSYLVHHRLLRLLAICVGISNLASTATFAIFPLYAIEPGTLGLDAAGFGLLITSVAAGSVAGSFIVEPLRRRLGERRTMILATTSFPLFSLAPAISTSVAVIAVIFFVAGAVSFSWNVITVSFRQRIVPEQLLGRINAGYRLVAWGTIPLGAALGGYLGSQYGLVATFWTAAALSAICIPLVYFGVTEQGLTVSPDTE
jgi:MFS family permease